MEMCARDTSVPRDTRAEGVVGARGVARPQRIERAW